MYECPAAAVIIATNVMALNDTDLLSYSSGGQNSEMCVTAIVQV